MTTPLICLAVMLLIVIATKIPVAIAQNKQGAKGYDNRSPRQQQAQLTGWGARALAAHQNTFEAAIIFTPAVLIATVAGTPDTASMAATLAVVHTAARIAYPMFYIANIHLARSAVWGIGFFSALWLAFLPLIG